MPRVQLWTGLRRLAGGSEVIEVEASTVGQMLDALARVHPGLEPALKAGTSVMIDGQVSVSRFTPISEQNEIHLLQHLKGG
jgi:molybdopterin synthase sulfur carrier subunit